MPQLDVPNHNVSRRMLLSFNACTITRKHTNKQRSFVSNLLLWFQFNAHFFCSHAGTNETKQKAYSHIFKKEFIFPHSHFPYSKEAQRNTSLYHVRTVHLFYPCDYRNELALMAWFELQYGAASVIQCSLMASLIVSSLRGPFIPSLIAIPSPTLSFHPGRAEQVLW